MVPRRMHRYWYLDFRIVQSTDMFPHDSLPMGLPFPLFYLHIPQLLLNTLLKYFIFEGEFEGTYTLHVPISPEPKHQEASPVSGLSRAQLVFCQVLAAVSSTLGECEPSAASPCLHCSTICGVTQPTSLLAKPQP